MTVADNELEKRIDRVHRAITRALRARRPQWTVSGPDSDLIRSAAHCRYVDRYFLWEVVPIRSYFRDQPKRLRVSVLDKQRIVFREGKTGFDYPRIVEHVIAAYEYRRDRERILEERDRHAKQLDIIADKLNRRCEFVPYQSPIFVVSSRDSLHVQLSFEAVRRTDVELRDFLRSVQLTSKDIAREKAKELANALVAANTSTVAAAVTTARPARRSRRRR